MKKPCKNCPIRKDVTTPEWTQKQLDGILICDTQVFNQMACHKSKEGGEIQCVGWVISQLKNGVENLGLRLGLASKRIKPSDYDLNFDVHNSIAEAFENKVL